MKSARLTPLKTYSTVVAAQRNALAKPLTLVKNVNVSFEYIFTKKLKEMTGIYYSL